MKFAKFVQGNNKSRMSEIATKQGLTLFQMYYNCDNCGNDTFRCGTLTCSNCHNASRLPKRKQVAARQLYLSGQYNVLSLAAKLKVAARDLRWYLFEDGILREKNSPIKSNAKFREESKVIMNLSRVGLLKQGHSDIRASSILQIFKDHTPKNMRVVTRWINGQIVTVNRVVM